MRKRLRDWPVTVYKYHVEPIGELPQAMWDTAKTMQGLWNNLARLHEATREAVSSAAVTAAQRKEAWAVFKNQASSLVKAAPLDWVAGPEVLDRFEATCRMAKQRPGKDGRPGWPKIQHRLERISIPFRFTKGGKPMAGLFTAKDNRVALRSSEGFARGRFVVDGRAIDFNIVLHRPMPANGVVKQAVWLGRRDVFGWHWSLALIVEAPQMVREASTGRVAGLDVGWRKFDNYIRVAMLTDSEGNSVEFRLPLVASTTKTRRLNKHLYSQGKSFEDTVPESYFELLNLDERIGLMVEDVKAKLKFSLVPSERGGNKDLPTEIRASVNALQKMRQGGLVRLLRMLESAGIGQGSQAELRAWLTENDKLRRRKAALQIRLNGRREWAYGNIASWIAKRYDTLVWEGDLKIKAMIEEKDKGRALKLGDRYHQWAATYDLRARIQKACAKFGCQIVDGQTAFSSSTCSICGRSVQVVDALTLTCSRGHVIDRDVNGAANLLRQMVDVGDMFDEPMGDLPEAIRGNFAVVFESSGGASLSSIEGRRQVEAAGQC